MVVPTLDEWRSARAQLHAEGKRSSPNPKKLKKRSVARPGGAATLAPIGDDDPAGDGMGRLFFLNEPGFASSALPSCPITPGAVYDDEMDMCQEATDDEDDEGEWYMLSKASDTGVGGASSSPMRRVPARNRSRLERRDCLR